MLAAVTASYHFSFFQLLVLCAYVMQILILVDVQYLRSVSFSIEKGSNSQHHSPMKIPPTEGILLPLNAIWKTLDKL